MKYLALLLFLIPLSLFGQVESQFNGTLNVFSASRIGSTYTFTISGIFSSTTTSYTSANSAVGDIVQVQSGSRFYWMHIYSIASNSGGVITCNVRDSSSTLTTFPSGKWSIFRPTPNLRLPLSPDGETNASRSATFNTLALRVDEIQTSVASATNCELTITKTNHGFRKWTPVFWNGSTYIRPTADSLVPDYIVVDSLTANTFKVATCGTYTTTLTNGLYWFTSASPGYSLTQDTTKVPLFQALNGKLILNPIVGFNLMSGSGSGDVTSSVLADSTAAIRADFPNNIINPSWLYVSLLNGNNETAIVGDPTHPWEDPFAAADYVEANGVYPNEIFVLDGTFYYIPAEDSLEVPVDPGYNKWINNESTMGLLRENIIFHFTSNTGIVTWRSPTQQTADQRGLFWTDGGAPSTIIDGYLSISGGSPIDQEYNVLGLDCSGGDLNLEFEQIDGAGIHFFKEGGASSNADLKIRATTLSFSIVYPNYFGGTVIFTGDDINGSLGALSGGYLEINKLNQGSSTLYLKGGEGSITKINSFGGDIEVSANGGIVVVNQVGGTFSTQSHENGLAVIPEVKLTANLDHVQIVNISSTDFAHEKLTLNCNPCTIGDSLEVSVINTDSSYVKLMGEIDLQGTNFISLEPHPTTPLTDKCFFFRDLEFKNPPSGIPSLRSQRANYAVIFMNCWSSSDFSTEGVIIGGEPINTY